VTEMVIFTLYVFASFLKNAVNAADFLGFSSRGLELGRSLNSMEMK
jgi:hypothetical protein